MSKTTKQIEILTPCEVLKKSLEANKRALKIYQDACRIYLHSAMQEFTPKFLKHSKTVGETEKHINYQRKNFEEAWGEYVRIRAVIEEQERTLALLEEAKNNKPVVKEGKMKD